MSLPVSRIAYADCFDYYDQAIDDPKGVRVPVPSIDAATHLRMRLHQARKIDRDDNAKTYEPDHFMHGRSNYDKITTRIRCIGNATYLYLEQVQTITGVEPLSEIDDEPSDPRRLHSPLAPSLDLGDRDRDQDRRQAVSDEPIIRSPQGLRRI